MPPPSGGKLKASRSVVPKLPRYHLRLDRAQVPDHSIPIVIALDRAPARGPDAPGELVARQPLQLGALRRRPCPRDSVPHIGCTREDRGERLEHRVDALVRLEPGHGEEPTGSPARAAPVGQLEAAAQLGRIDARSKAGGIGAQEYDAQPLAVAVPAQLAQDR